MRRGNPPAAYPTQHCSVPLLAAGFPDRPFRGVLVTLAAFGGRWLVLDSPSSGLRRYNRPRLYIVQFVRIREV